MAFDIVAFDFPVAFAASPKVYTTGISYRLVSAIVNRLPVHVQFLGHVGLCPQALLLLAVGDEGRAGVLRGVALGRFLLCIRQPIRPQGVVIPA